MGQVTKELLRTSPAEKQQNIGKLNFQEGALSFLEISLCPFQGVALPCDRLKESQSSAFSVFATFGVRISAFSISSLCGVSSDPCFFLGGGDERDLPHFPRVGFESPISKTRPALL